jgi:hypothetical protein
MAQPPDALALLVWASLVAPLPLLGLSFAFEGQAEIGDALAGVAALLFRGGGQRPVLLRRLDRAAQAPHGRRGHAVRAAGPGVRDRQRGLLLGERPSALELGGDAQAAADACARGGSGDGAA